MNRTGSREENCNKRTGSRETCDKRTGSREKCGGVHLARSRETYCATGSRESVMKRALYRNSAFIASTCPGRTYEHKSKYKDRYKCR